MRKALGRLIPCLAFLVTASALEAAAADLSPYEPGPGKYPRFQAREAEPGLTLGVVPDLPLPKTLLYSVTAEELAADAKTWVDQGIQGFFLTGVAGEWSNNVWATDGEPWTIGASDKTFQQVQHATAAARELGCDVFLTISFGHTFEWFNDTAWQHIEHIFQQSAIFARDAGCTGLAIDIEYIYPQYHFIWSEYTYDGYTRAELVNKVRERMTGVAAAMYDAFPEMVLLTLPEHGLDIGGHIQAAWIEEAAKRNAPGGVHLCTEYTYRRFNPRYMLAHTWQCSQILHGNLSPEADAYWRKTGSVAGGLWPFGVDPDDYHGPEPTIDQWRQTYAGSLMMSRRYNWIYSHNLRPFMLGRDQQDYWDAPTRDAYMNVVADRAVVTNPALVATARDVRNLVLRDYTDELGLVIVPTFAAPREQVEVGLFAREAYEPSAIARLNSYLWDLGRRIHRGDAINFQQELGTQTNWLLIGPFPNSAKAGFDTAYPPESKFEPNGTYDGISGAVGWKPYTAPPGYSAVDLTKVFQPTDEVCAYALAYVVADRATDAFVGVGANDSWKLWLGNGLVYANANEGRIILDRDRIPVTLPQGTTPILLKVCNNRKDWGFILRITDADGHPVPGVRITTTP